MLVAVQPPGSEINLCEHGQQVPFMPYVLLLKQVVDRQVKDRKVCNHLICRSVIINDALVLQIW